MRIGFLIMTLLSTAFSPATYAQCPESNQEIFEQQVMSMLKEYYPTYKTFKEIEGHSTKEIERNIVMDTSSVNVLRIEEPEIVFTKIDKTHIQRKIESGISIVGAAAVASVNMSLDTLEKSCLKKVRTTEDKSFKGDRPGLFSRVFFPVLLIVAGLVIILGLFYIRS